MKIRVILGLSAIMLLVLLFCWGCSTSGGRTVYVDYTSSACWSKDGRSLFYTATINDKWKLCRYNIDTGKRHVYNNISMELPSALWPLRFYDVSRDEKQIIAGNSNELFIVDLHTGNIRKILTTTEQNAMDHVFWLKNDLILFTRRKKEPDRLRSYVYLTNLNTGNIKKVSDAPAYNIYPAIDGNSFLYDSMKDERFHIINLRTGNDRKIGKGKLCEQRTFTFLYLSDRLLVYTYDTPKPVFEMLDLRTMKTKRIQMVGHDMYIDGDVSPDFTRQWFAGPIGSDKTAGGLYLESIPRETIKQLRNVR